MQSAKEYVKAEDFDEYPFTREEFAVSAATYLDQIPADTPEDPFRASNVVISHLPPSCTKLFSQGIITCPYCHASCEVPIRSLPSSPIPRGPIPWVQRCGWHEADCERSDHLPSVTKLCSWVLLELYCISQMSSSLWNSARFTKT